ncbi:MAG: hypothetical protein RBT65_07240 [Methanolobus sp.]|jgi:hypothetical protein|nr:hypothetical protein [Methanolobus sp.]
MQTGKCYVEENSPDNPWKTGNESVSSASKERGGTEIRQPYMQFLLPQDASHYGLIRQILKRFPAILFLSIVVFRLL